VNHSYTFYQVAQEYRPQQKAKPKAWSLMGGDTESVPSPVSASTPASYQSLGFGANMQASNAGSNGKLRQAADGRWILPMSRSTIINLDPQGKSDRSETAL
jgi:hypothetical protein